MSSAPQVPREKLVQVLVAMLEKQGPKMIAELEKRAKAGQGLQARGLTADASMLQDALDEFESRQVVVVGKGAVEVNSPEKKPTTPSSPVVGSAPLPPSSASSPPKATTTSGGGGGAKWVPPGASASLLASKAQMECEHAEQFVRTVQVVGNVKVGVLLKPDMQSEMTGAILNQGEKFPVVARFLCQRDGRVYLRLKKQDGWVSTRSRKDYSKVVVSAIPGEPAIEPAKFSQPIESTALRFLPELDSADASEAPTAAAEDLDDDEDMELNAVDAADAPPEEEGDADADADMAEAMEADDEEEEEAAADDEGDEADGDAQDETADVPASQGSDAGAKDGSPLKVRKIVHKFKVVVGRCPILQEPCAEELMAHGQNKVLQMKQEFISDGIFLAVPEQRYYLRLTRGRGWICEQSRNDIRRFAVVPLSKRKQPLSKKMARVVAFRGGDTGGLTRLGKDDLVKNANGKIVSKRASEAAKKRVRDGVGIGKWMQAVKRARDELGLKGFVAVKKGTEVYEKAQQYYKETK